MDVEIVIPSEIILMSMVTPIPTAVFKKTTKKSDISLFV